MSSISLKRRMNLANEFFESARRHASQPAVFWGPDEFNYDQVRRQVVGVAATLGGEMGVKRGDRVALWLKNCPEFIPAFLGILAADAVAVPINNFLKPDEVSFILNDAGADVLVTDEELGAHENTLQAARPGLRVLQVGEGVTPPTAPPPTPASADNDLAVLIYTSGTTGRPKGAMLSHRNLLSNVESCGIVLEVVDHDRMAVLLPLFHSYMLTVGLLLPLLTGGSMVLVRSISPMKSALEELFARKATILPAIPQFYRGLASAPLTGPLPIRVCISGAAPLPVQVLKQFEAKYGIPLLEGYGLSEASPVVSKNPIHGVRKPGSIGLPIPNVQMSIQDDAGRQLPPREIGEVCVRGANVMLGYWNQPEETAKVLRDGWLLTGDIGYHDEDGYFYITDRKKDMLLVNGINVYPREVEEIIHQFPGVKEAAVVGARDRRRGEIPVAFVAADDDVKLDESALTQFLKERLADYKVPRQITVVPALPRNATGKILKTTLRESLALAGV